MGVEENGFAIFDDGAVLLLSEVGEHYSMLSKSPQAIMDSLRRLHQNQILHGDARVENVVFMKGKPCWIDFAETTFVFSDLGPEAEETQLRESLRARFGYIAT
jgi:serine/threonine-protein kinase RIO1